MIITAALSSGIFLMDKEKTRSVNQEMIGTMVQALMQVTLTKDCE